MTSNSRTLVLTASVLLMASVVAAGTLRVDERQRVTVAGEFASLRGLLEDVCAEAGAELRSFDVPDRPVRVSFRELPLRDALERLLVRENHLLGLRLAAEPDGAPRVSWIDVTGLEEDPRPVPEQGVTPLESGPRSGAQVDAPPAAGPDPDVSKRLAEELGPLADFLKANPSVLEDALRQNPDGRSTIEALGARAQPGVADLIDEMVDATTGRTERP